MTATTTETNTMPSFFVLGGPGDKLARRLGIQQYYEVVTYTRFGRFLRRILAWPLLVTAIAEAAVIAVLVTR